MNKVSRLKTSVPFKWISITAYAVLIIPILIFFWGWLKWYFALLFSIILLVGAFWSIKCDYWINSDKIDLPVFHFVLIAAVIGIWILFSGSCGFGVSNIDTPWRTACLRDLINFDWPVYFPETGVTLCYYFTFWLVPALFGKLFGLTAAFAVQWLWMTLIVVTSFLLIAYLFRNYSVRTLWLICVFLVMWSGLNLLGAAVIDIFGWNLMGIQFGLNEMYCQGFYNGEGFNFLYRSNQEFIEMCYNQIPVWLVVPLFLQNRNIRNFAFLGLILFPFSPWGTLGLGILMIIDAVQYIAKNSFKSFFKEAFSVQNICAILAVAVVFILFLTSGSTGDSDEGIGFGILTLSKFDVSRIVGLVVFWVCEFGIYFAFMWRKYKKDFNFVVLLPILMLIPLFWAGNIWGRDFCMNVSLPALFILMIYMIGYVKDEVSGKKMTPVHAVLIFSLAVAATTPVFDWTAKVMEMINKRSCVIQNDRFYTYSNKQIELMGNQGAVDAEQSLFFKYLAKPLTEDIPEISVELLGLGEIVDLDTYLSYLLDKDCAVYIAVQTDHEYSLSAETVGLMKQLGFGDVDILTQSGYYIFIGILNDGQLVTEQLEAYEYIEYSGTLNGYPIEIKYDASDEAEHYKISIKGADYSSKQQGFNIVIVDNSSNEVADSFYCAV